MSEIKINQNNPNTTEPPKEKETRKVTRTYSKDLAKVVQEKGGELFRIIRTEQKEKEEEIKVEGQKNKLNFIFIIGGAILILVGIISFFSFGKNNLPVQPSVPSNLIIFSDKDKTIDITCSSKEKFLSLVNQTGLESGLKNGEISSISLIEKTASGDQKDNLDKFLSLLNINLPTTLKPYVEKNYMFGFYYNSGLEPFLILKVNSYPDAFTGMSAWENHMFDDLYELFQIDLNTESIDLSKKMFENAVIANYDSRVIKNGVGDTVFFYTFLDEKTILIAKSGEALSEIVTRLYSPKTQ